MKLEPTRPPRSMCVFLGAVPLLHLLRRSFDANDDNEDNRKRSQILSTVAAIPTRAVKL